VCNEDNPPLIIRGKSRSQKVVYAHEADLLLDGNVVGTLVYDPQHPLDCGARIWLQTDKLQIKPRLRGKTGEKAHG
jgi:hypothetical protein